mgnify:CR=1 FL=1
MPSDSAKDRASFEESSEDRGFRERLEQLASDFDPNNPEELREAMTSGALIPPKSPEQLAIEQATTGAKVAGKDLKLNGAGVRTRAVFKVYAMGLYLGKKETTVDGILAAQGPRRFNIVMLRDVSGEDFGEAFMSGINKNIDKAEKSKIVNQLGKFGEIFTAQGNLKKGDILISDWVPGVSSRLAIQSAQRALRLVSRTFLISGISSMPSFITRASLSGWPFAQSPTIRSADLSASASPSNKGRCGGTLKVHQAAAATARARSTSRPPLPSSAPPTASK